MALNEIKVGPIAQADGTTPIARGGRNGETIVGDAHGRYYEAASRGKVYVGGNQAATAFSVALNTTYTGVVLANPVNSGFNLALLQASLVLTVAPVAIASIALFGGYVQGGITVHTTPLVPWSTLLGNTGGIAKISAAATLVGTPLWLPGLKGGFTAGALSADGAALADIGGSIIVPPGAYVGIGALTAVTGMGSLVWEEVPIYY